MPFGPFSPVPWLLWRRPIGPADIIDGTVSLGALERIAPTYTTTNELPRGYARACGIIP